MRAFSLSITEFSGMMQLALDSASMPAKVHSPASSLTPQTVGSTPYASHSWNLQGQKQIG